MKALRNLSEEIRLRPPELDIHPDLPKRVAALLLELTGHKVDEDKAVAIAPDRPFNYERDYLRKPGQSWFPLERRHAEIVLADRELPLVSRAQRTADLWLDPNFKPPATFVAELRKTAECIDVEKLDKFMEHTSEDYDFERLEPALARCAPDLLADLIRRKLQNLSTCPPEFRQSRAMSVTNHLILADKAELEAVRTLRLISKNDNKNDAYIIEQLLLMEFQNLEPQAQFNLLIESGQKDFSPCFCKVLRRPTRDDIDTLITRYATASSSKQRVLLILLSILSVELTDNSWSWVKGFVKHQDGELREFAFKILACANPMRFGQALVVEGWSWIPGEKFDVNHYGTSALIKATSDIPFDELAPRLAPWQLLKAARLRGAIPTEVRLAAKKFALKSFSENIIINSEDFKPVLIHAMDIVEQWLEGYCESMESFQQRGPLTELAFWALCEALLTHAPEKGAQLSQLWHKLLLTRTTRYIGMGSLMRMVFRVPDSPEVMALRKELVRLDYFHNDQKLLELAIVASSNRQCDWLDTFIQNDQISPFVWHRRRAEVLAGFTANNSLPVAGTWPDGEIRTTHEKFALRSTRYRWIEACAHHWWRSFLNAGDPAEAYAAWVLFLRSADRRAWVWIYQDMETADDSTDFFQRKIKHFRLNHSNLKNAMKKREGNFGDKMDQHFLYRKTEQNVGPWFR